MRLMVLALLALLLASACGIQAGPGYDTDGAGRPRGPGVSVVLIGKDGEVLQRWTGDVRIQWVDGSTVSFIVDGKPMLISGTWTVEGAKVTK
jgi:hypothetical protein